MPVSRPGAAGPLALVLVLLASLWTSPGALGQTVPLVCSVSISNIAFGSVDVLPGASVQTSAVLSISCLNVTVISGNLYVCVALSARSLQGSTATLAYDIASQGQASITTPLAVPLATLQLNGTATFPLTATLAAAQQNTPPDNYVQTLTFTASLGTQSCSSGLSVTTTSSLQVTATVVKACDVSTSDLGFGSVGTLSTAVIGQSTVTLLCTRGTGYSIALDGGLSVATNPTARQMTAGGQTVFYGLYQDSARTRPWGTVASSTLGGIGIAVNQSIPVYGLVPVQPTPPPGTYNDTIVVTVTY